MTSKGRPHWRIWLQTIGHDNDDCNGVEHGKEWNKAWPWSMGRTHGGGQTEVRAMRTWVPTTLLRKFWHFSKCQLFSFRFPIQMAMVIKSVLFLVKLCLGSFSALFSFWKLVFSLQFGGFDTYKHTTILSSIFLQRTCTRRLNKKSLHCAHIKHYFLSIVKVLSHFYFFQNSYTLFLCFSSLILTLQLIFVVSCTAYHIRIYWIFLYNTRWEPDFSWKNHNNLITFFLLT
jgi:hypothetical protein